MLIVKCNYYHTTTETDFNLILNLKKSPSWAPFVVQRKS
nr:MAG TPA: hypothetical protein [Caudoviricetes sp.]